MPRCPACDAPDSRPSWNGRARFEDFHYEFRECMACRTAYVEPMPDAALLDKIYAPGYLEQHYATELEGESKSMELERELEGTARRIAMLRPGGRLLDVGCGAGMFLAAATRAGLDAVGHERMAATAARATAATGLRVLHGPLAAVEERFDVVHFADVLEHAPRPLELLGPAARLLRPGGLLVARGPLQNQPNLFHGVVRLQRIVRARLGRLGEMQAVPGHVSLFTLDGWHALFARAGLRAVDERVYEVHWPAPERPTASLTYVVRELSLAASRTPLGRRFRLGDRVVTFAETA